MSYNILIAEDDVLISEHLKHIVSEMNHNVCAIVSSEQQAVQFLENNQLPDLALLDIQMHGENQGISIAKRLNKLNVPFIYITSFSDKNTLQPAIKEKPAGYIIKPFSHDEISLGIEEVLMELKQSYITVKDNKMLRKIYIKDILYLMSSNVYVEIFTTERRYLCRLKLTDLKDQLPVNQFIKVHRSYVVNKTYVQSFSKNNLEIEGISIPIAKAYRELVAAIFETN